MKRTLSLFLVILFALLQFSGCTTPNATDIKESDTTKSDIEALDPPKVVGNRIWDTDHPDDSEVNPYFSVTLSAIPNVTFSRNSKHLVCANDEPLADVHGYCTGFYTCDFTQDGIPELCFNLSFGNGMCDQHITIIDYTTKEVLFSLWDRGNYDYYLFLRNGEPCVKETLYDKDDAVRTGKLIYSDGNISVAWDSEVQFNFDRDAQTPGEPIA
jgi:hypothetical protein